MIQLADAFKEGQAGLKSRRAQSIENESRVVDGKCIITVRQGALHECDLCI